MTDDRTTHDHYMPASAGKGWKLPDRLAVVEPTEPIIRFRNVREGVWYGVDESGLRWRLDQQWVLDEK